MEIKFTDNSAEILKAFEQATERALEKIGLAAEGYAKKLAPVDTGRLRNSISHEVDGQEVYIGSNVEYAPYVELGTSKQKAQPFLKPAATEHSGTYRAILESEYKNG
jgi:HK97 gp10 family phage protein